MNALEAAAAQAVVELELDVEAAGLVDLLDRAGGIGWLSLTPEQKRTVVHHVRTVERYRDDPFEGLPQF